MFNWLGNLFPYSDLHSLNLDWLLSKMKEIATQAAQAIADSAKALAQVAEAKAAALSAQTAAHDAQTAANNAQTAANNAADSAENAVNVAQAAKSAAQSAQSAVQTAQSTAENAQSAAQTAQSAAQTAQSAAQTAQNTANTAQSAAQTAQSAAENAQSLADTANEKINTLNKRFPIKTADIADKAVSPQKLSVTQSYLYNDTTSNGSKFPREGSATIDQITSGIYDTYVNRLSIKTDYLQVGMDIPNTVFKCVSPIVKIINKAAGLSAIAPIIVIKMDTNDIYNGFIKLSQEEDVDPQDLKIKCEVIFNAVPPFDNNTRFVITANPVSAKLWPHV